MNNLIKVKFLARIRKDDAITVPRTVRKVGFKAGKFIQVTLEETDFKES